jgi:hypothetical protein
MIMVGILIAIFGIIYLTSSLVIIEDAGKKIVMKQPEVQDLISKYGEDRVFVKALDRHIIGEEWHSGHSETDNIARANHDDLLSMVLKTGLSRDEIGCVIVVYGISEGYVYWEDKDLNIVASETLADFQEHTVNVSPDAMSRFYLSLR